MDIALINPALTSQQAAGLLGQGRGTVIPVKRQSEIVEEPVKVAAVEQVDVGQADQKRYEAVRRAAQSMFKDAYVVNDSTFTIYKDNSGQYITRFTNLRDGSVTYYPEPEIVQHRARNGESFVEIDA
jgi:hypothetical protein